MWQLPSLLYSLSFLRFYLLLEKEGGERNINARENINWLPLTGAPTRGGICNPGLCPDRELNLSVFLCGTTPNQLRHTSQGCIPDFKENTYNVPYL